MLTKHKESAILYLEVFSTLFLRKEKPQQAEVLAVGPGGTVDGKEVKMNISVGQTVIFSKYSGTTVEVDEEEYIIVKQDDILAVVE